MNGITWPDIRIFFRMSGQLHRMSGYIFGCSDFYFFTGFSDFFSEVRIFDRKSGFFSIFSFFFLPLFLIIPL